MSAVYGLHSRTDAKISYAFGCLGVKLTKVFGHQFDDHVLDWREVRIHQLREEGFTQNEIGKKFSVTQGIVCRILHRRGRFVGNGTGSCPVASLEQEKARLEYDKNELKRKAERLVQTIAENAWLDEYV